MKKGSAVCPVPFSATYLCDALMMRSNMRVSPPCFTCMSRAALIFVRAGDCGDGGGGVPA